MLGRRKISVTPSDLSISFASNAISEVPTEFEIRRKIKYGNPLQAAWGIFAEYCSHSTIHGIRYLGERRRPLIERIFWVFVFCISIGGCARLCHEIWLKWNRTPVIVSFAEKSTPLWEIPYPSIVLCPEIKYQPELFNFSRIQMILNSNSTRTESDWDYQYVSEEDIKNFHAVSQVCSEKMDFSWDNISDEEIDFQQVLFSLAPTLNSSNPFCKWRNTIKDCHELFKKIITHEGVCYHFNGLDNIWRDYGNLTETGREANWSLERGYFTKDVDHPYRVLSGARQGMFLALQGFNMDMDYRCSGAVQGFKVFVISPDDAPQTVKTYLRVPFGKEVLITMKPSMTTTSRNLRIYSPNRRQCYFAAEKVLRFYNVYTQKNCNFECLTNFTMKKCGCVRFAMPRSYDMPICRASQIKCYQGVEDSLLRLELEHGIVTPEGEAEGECSCLPSCFSLEYSAEISQADFDVNALLRAYNESYDVENPGFVMSRLSIFFKSYQFIQTRRSELYGTTDFLANCGGLLGLFMGFSTLSLIEIIYFFTVRLVSNVRMRKDTAERQNIQVS